MVKTQNLAFLPNESGSPGRILLAMGFIKPFLLLEDWEKGEKAILLANPK